MSKLRYTHHAEARMRQRGYRKGDVNLVLGTATPIAGDAYFLSDKDAAREIKKRKRKIRQLERFPDAKPAIERNAIISRLKGEIQKLERLRGSKIVVENGKVVTCYRPPRAPRRPDSRRRGRRRRRSRY